MSQRAAADRPDKQLQLAAGFLQRTMEYPVSLSSLGGGLSPRAEESHPCVN